MKITLTSQQKLQLEQMHDIERDSRVCDRIKAVLLASEGWRQTMISKLFVFMNLPLHATSVTTYFLKNLSLRIAEAKAGFLLFKPCA